MENMNENTALTMVEENDNGFIADLTTKKTMFCSVKAETQDEKIALYNAVQNPTKRISECANLEINVKNIICETVLCRVKDKQTGAETGEVTECPRIILIDDKGVSYTSVSYGIFSSVKMLISIFGVPTWNKPIKVIPTEIHKNEKRILTLKLA